MRRWCWPRARARTRARWPPRSRPSWKRCRRSPPSRSPVPASSTSASRPTRWRDELRDDPSRRRALRPVEDRQQRAGQRRICLGQPDRADAHGPLPRRGGRRRARPAARGRGLPGHQGILRQRRRRAGRRARPLAPPALPRGARRRHRRDPRGPVSRATIWSRSAPRSPRNSATSTPASPKMSGSTCSASARSSAMLDLIRHDLGLLGIHHDHFASEAELQGSGAVERGDGRAAPEGPGL